MKAYGIDLDALSSQAGAISTQAINNLWQNCTKENLDKITAMVSTANENLKANGIDVYELTEQAATSLGQASVLLANKMWDDAQNLLAEAWQSPLVQEQTTQEAKQAVIDKLEFDLKASIRESVQAGCVEDLVRISQKALNRASDKMRKV